MHVQVSGRVDGGTGASPCRPLWRHTSIVLPQGDAGVAGRPDDHKRSTDDELPRHRTQRVATVVGVGPVVTEHVVAVLRHRHGGEAAVFGDHRRLGQRAAVDHDRALTHDHPFAGQPDDALDDVDVGVGPHDSECLQEGAQRLTDALGAVHARASEHDHLAAGRLAQPVGDLLGQYPVADVQGGHHRLRGDVEGLQEERLDDERQDEGGNHEHRQLGVAAPGRGWLLAFLGLG